MNIIKKAISMSLILVLGLSSTGFAKDVKKDSVLEQQRIEVKKEFSDIDVAPMNENKLKSLELKEDALLKEKKLINKLENENYKKVEIKKSEIHFKKQS